MKSIISTLTLLFMLPVLALAQEANDEPPYGMEELEAYSVFADAYRSGDYELARDYGQWMLEAKPREIEGYDGFSLERQFDRMINIYVETAEQKDDPTEKSEDLAEAAAIFNEVFTTFGEDEIDLFEWHLKEGRFLQEHHENLDDADMSDAINSYEKLYEMDAERFSEEGDGYYARVLLTRYESNGETEKVQAMIDEVEQYASSDLQATIDEVREALFESPEDRIEFLESRVADADGAEKEEMLESLVDLYDQIGEADKAKEYAMELYELDNSFENTEKVASIHLSDGDYREALNYLKESAEKAPSSSEEKEILLNIAETHQQLDEMETARDYARQAMDMDSEYGEAYIRMASIYAGTVSECSNGSNLERKDRTVYWLVLDYLDQAKEVDPSLARDANSRIEAYQEAMPSSEDKFFSDWEAGDSFEINGELKECYAWINETTTVR